MEFPASTEEDSPASTLPLIERLARVRISTSCEKDPETESVAPSDSQDHNDRFPYVIELYGFDASLKTKELMQEFRKNYSSSDFRLKWVDDTHAIGLFASSRQAWLAAKALYQKFKTRLLKDGTPQSKEMAEKLAEELRPSPDPHNKPKTTAVVARRMVAGALGLRIKVSEEQRDKERREIQAAKDKKRQNKPQSQSTMS